MIGGFSIVFTSALLLYAAEGNYAIFLKHRAHPAWKLRAALGTLIARIFALLFICGFFFYREKRAEYRVRYLLTPCGDLMGEYFRISIPVLVSDGLLAPGNNSAAMIMGRIGDPFAAAYSVTMVVQQPSFVLTQGIANAGGITTGRPMGRNTTKPRSRAILSLCLQEP